MPTASAEKAALDFLKKHGIKIVDFKFIDLPGMWQHTSVPVDQIDASTFENGIGFDGSSIRGFQEIQESDMVLIPDPASVRVDTFLNIPTASFICSAFDPREQAWYGRDPRNVAQRAQAHLKAVGIADAAYFGPELEFYIFDHISFDNAPYLTGYAIDSEEAHWNSGDTENPNLAYSLRPKEGYFPVQPSDKHTDIRSEMVLALKEWGVDVEMHHHEVATAGQTEIDIRYATLAAASRQRHDLQVRHAQRRAPPRQGGHLHAQATLRRQRFGHARPPEPVERWQEPLLLVERLCRALADWPLLHRRAPHAHRLALGLLRTHACRKPLILLPIVCLLTSSTTDGGKCLIFTVAKALNHPNTTPQRSHRGACGDDRRSPSRLLQAFPWASAILGLPPGSPAPPPPSRIGLVPQRSSVS